MKLTKILSLILCLILLCGLLLCGCKAKKDNSAKSSADEAATTEVTIYTTAPATELTGVTTKAQETVPATENETKATSPAQKNEDSNADSNAGPVDNSPEAEPMTCTVTVADKDYTFELGEKFTYTCYLKTPDKIEDIQAQLLYTGGCLKLLDAEDEEILPVFGEYAIINTANPGIVKYNATHYKGINFKDEATLITLDFEVVFGGTASIANSIEVMTGVDGSAYAELFKLAKDVKIRETIG